MFVLKLLSRLPLPVLYAISDLLFIAGYYVAGYRKNLVRQNLCNAFPEKSEKERLVIERQFYRNLCDYAVETLKLLTMPKKSLMKRMRYTNPEIMVSYRERGQSVILLSSHHFNWEWLLVSGILSLPVPVDFVYQPLKNKFFDKLMQHIRTRFGGFAITRNDVARQFAARKHIVRGIAIVADQYPGYQTDKRHVIHFMHQETAFFLGGQQIASLTQYPVLYGVVERVNRGYYTCTLVHIADPPHQKDSVEVVEKYAREVEQVIHNHPSNWLWSHDRWKTRHVPS